LAAFNKLGTGVMALEDIPNFVVFDLPPLIDAGYISIINHNGSLSCDSLI
jgi:hypothetical protein